ncbi:MAG: hypothetical protein KKB82_05645 [Candidatus Omnitrophica bacterium]|nr:hypothetical protein [Candidatus Omnitrophota bacterium]
MCRKIIVQTILFILINSFFLLDICWAADVGVFRLKQHSCLSPALQMNSNIITGSFFKLYHDHLFVEDDFGALFKRLEKIKLAVFDLDGTLAFGSRDAPRAIIEGLKFLLINKTHVAVITGSGVNSTRGRIINELIKSLKDEGAFWAIDYLHVFTHLGNKGFRLKDDGEQEEYFRFEIHRSLAPKLIKIVREVCDKEDVHYSIFSKKGKNNNFLVFRIVFEELQLIRNRTQMMQEIAEGINEKFRQQDIGLSVLKTGEASMEIAVKAKGYAVGFLMDELGVEPEEIMFVGDSFGPRGGDRSMRFDRTLNSLFFNVGLDIDGKDLNKDILTTTLKGPEASQRILQLLKIAKAEGKSQTNEMRTEQADVELDELNLPALPEGVLGVQKAQFQLLHQAI